MAKSCLKIFIAFPVGIVWLKYQKVSCVLKVGGYRAKYVAQTARFIASRQNWLESIMELKYADAKKQLLRLPGVGEKVADCTFCFSEAIFWKLFQSIHWIEKSMEKRYKLNGWNTAQKLHFASMHFGKFAGLAQQFLFSAERLKVFKD